MAKISLYEQLIQIAFDLSDAVKKGKVHTDYTDGGIYEHSATEIDDLFLKDAVAIIDLELFNGLSAHSCKFLLRIIQEMKMNNVFWICPAVTTSRHRASIAELKRHNILAPTEKPLLFIINPFKLRRGKPLSSIMSSLHYYHKDNSIRRLQDLRPPSRAMLGDGK